MSVDLTDAPGDEGADDRSIRVGLACPVCGSTALPVEKVFFRPPDNWDEMTVAEQERVARPFLVAIELLRRNHDNEVSRDRGRLGS